MLGITESVFNPKPEDENDEDDKKARNIPMSILRLQASQKSQERPGCDVARNAGPPKMKRPMETNRLETGPPSKKMNMLGSVLAGAQPSAVSSAFTAPGAIATNQAPNKSADLAGKQHLCLLDNEQILRCISLR